MIPSARLLGFAFAASDLLLELDQHGVITFAAGAPPQSSADGAGYLVGQRLRDLVRYEDANSDPISTLDSGKRSGAIEVTLMAGEGFARPAQLHAFAPAQIAPRVCCAIAWTGPLQASAVAPAAPTLPDRSEFEAMARDALAAARRGSGPLTLALVSAPVPEGGAEGRANPLGALWKRVERIVQGASWRGTGAASMGAGRLALLHGESAGSLDELVRQALGGASCSGVNVEQAALRTDLDPLLGMRALRYALDACLQEGPSNDGARLKRSLDAGLNKTLREAETFRRNVSQGAFALHFQPVVDLKTRQIQHYEALVRFQSGESPGGIIHLANELGLIAELDTAVIEAGIARLLAERAGVRIALNVSEGAICSPTLLTTLLKAVPKDRRGDLILEINEAAVFRNLETTAARLGALKREGFGLSLDDFATATHSLDRLSTLPVDWVKLDPGLTRRLDTDPKTITLLTHVDRLCRALGMKSTARGVETEHIAQMLTNCGVNCAQGFLFGRPSPEIASQRSPVRRQGYRESWG